MKYFKTTLLFLLTLTSCNAGSKNSSISSSITFKNELQEYFNDLKENNFSINYSDYYVNNGVERNQNFYFTKYSLQTSGSYGFIGYAQDKNDTIFRYNLVDGEVVSGTPLINSATGKRYKSIYEVTCGLDKFDISYLDNEKDSEGYYTYTFGENLENDKIFASVFLYKSIAGDVSNDYKVKMKLVSDSLLVEAQMLGYDVNGDGNLVYDRVSSLVYDVKKTENTEIKKYLNDGKTSKTPLDLNFFKLINPYLYDINYTCDLTSENMRVNNNFKVTEYCTNDAILDEYTDGEKFGFLLDNHSVVIQYSIENEKIKIEGTPFNQQESTPYYSLYGGLIETSFYDLSYDTFVGYIDEEHPNSYIITDSQAIYTLSYICYITLSDEMACSSIRLEVVDADKHEFKLYIPLYNKKTNTQLGEFNAHFYNFGNTQIKEVDRYLSRGGSPLDQDRVTLSHVLDKFKNGNYSCDVLTSLGLAKYYYTPNYFYIEVYGSSETNVGYINIDSKVYSFNIINNQVVVDKSKSYAIALPGCGSSYLAGDDLNYFSHFDDRLFYVDSYEVSNTLGVDYWKIKDLELSKKIFNYVFNNPTTIYPTGSGILVQDGEDAYDVRLTVISSFIDQYGNEGGQAFTYYDINNTFHPTIEAYLLG